MAAMAQKMAVRRYRIIGVFQQYPPKTEVRTHDTTIVCWRDQYNTVQIQEMNMKSELFYDGQFLKWKDKGLVFKATVKYVPGRSTNGGTKK